MTAARTGRKQPSIRTLWAIAKSPELHLTDEDLHAVVYQDISFPCLYTSCTLMWVVPITEDTTSTDVQQRLFKNTLCDVDNAITADGGRSRG